MDIKRLRITSPLQAILLTFLSFTNALPWSGPDPTASHRPANWNPRPTKTPQLVPELFKRDILSASICGWIDGDPDQPAACSSREKCVYDIRHGIVGCCPRKGACTEGVFTSCVHSAHRDLNPSVLTWYISSSKSSFECNHLTFNSTGGSVCYRNEYQGGYSQYRCGSSADGKSIATTYSDQERDYQLKVVYTPLSLATSLTLNVAPPSPNATSGTTINSAPPSSAPSSTMPAIGSASTPSSVPASPVVGAQSVASITSAIAAATSQSSQVQAGIIAGSVVGGIGVLFALLALGCGLMRRRKKKYEEERLRSIVRKEKPLLSDRFV